MVHSVTLCYTLTPLWHRKSSNSLDLLMTAEGTVGAPTCLETNQLAASYWKIEKTLQEIDHIANSRQLAIHGRRLACLCCKSVAMKSEHILCLYGLLAFQKISFGKNRKKESKDRYADLCNVFLWNLLNWLPYHALKVSLMQYQANPYTNFFQTSHVALPWVIYSPYIIRFCGDRLTTKHCSRLPWITFQFKLGFAKKKIITIWNRISLYLGYIPKSRNID
jgi:hypothetical protein